MVLVPVPGVQDAVVRAVVYARSLRAAHTEAILMVTDPQDQEGVVAAWHDHHLDIPLVMVEAPFRDLGPPLLEEIRRHTAKPGTVVTVVLPELVPRHWWEQLLHNQTALFVKRLLLFEPAVVLTSVPVPPAPRGGRRHRRRRRLIAGMATAQRSSGGSVFKRVLLGRAFSSARMEHTLLPKMLALPVFASDALSSVAYATGEIFLALALVTSDPQPYVLPIAAAIALLLAIVVSSYRQTVRAYPSGGGAYIVSKENLGQFAGLVAAAALLFDYMMTVVVSIVAGVVAIQSAFPEVEAYAVQLSIGFVALVTLANLRGSKESGVLFAIPTYGFVAAFTDLIRSGSSGASVGARRSGRRCR